MTKDIYAHLREDEIVDFLEYKLDQKSFIYAMKHINECDCCLIDLLKTRRDLMIKKSRIKKGAS